MNPLQTWTLQPPPPRQTGIFMAGCPGALRVSSQSGKRAGKRCWPFSRGKRAGTRCDGPEKSCRVPPTTVSVPDYGPYGTLLSPTHHVQIFANFHTETVDVYFNNTLALSG